VNQAFGSGFRHRGNRCFQCFFRIFPVFALHSRDHRFNLGLDRGLGCDIARAAGLGLTIAFFF